VGALIVPEKKLGKVLLRLRAWSVGPFLKTVLNSSYLINEKAEKNNRRNMDYLKELSLDRRRRLT
jgi:hypothetical protein